MLNKKLRSKTMGSKYTADCNTYPYKGYTEYEFQSEYLIPFIIKLIKAIKKYPIIDIYYRGHKRMK